MIFWGCGSMAVIATGSLIDLLSISASRATENHRRAKLTGHFWCERWLVWPLQLLKFGFNFLVSEERDVSVNSLLSLPVLR